MMRASAVTCIAIPSRNQQMRESGRLTREAPIASAAASTTSQV
jgi:hypothetical protein